MLTITDLAKEFPAKREKSAVRAVDGVSFTVEAGKFFTLLGPSGCGKTTTLRCVAGLEHPTEGEIAVDGRVLFSGAKRVRVNAASRGLGMVFQSYAIWPHMTVAQNVAFPLQVGARSKRPKRKEVAERVDRVLSVVRLEGFKSRPATDLSGGQQQRLALARALIMEPSVLLLDEPLSNLDAKLRTQMRLELKRLQREIGITTLYVTHDQTEALAMSDVVAVMNEGQVVQFGRPREIYGSPANRFVAGFIGDSNFFTGRVGRIEAEHVQIELDGVTAWAGRGTQLAAGDECTVAIRPENITISSQDDATAYTSSWRGVVTAKGFGGEHVEYRIDVPCGSIMVRTHPSLRFRLGEEVWVRTKADDVRTLGA